MHWAGFDVGKRFHRACVLDGKSGVVLSRKVEATEERMEAFLSEVAEGLGGAEERVVGVDLLGGPATLVEAVLLSRGERVRYVSGTSVDRTRDAYRGGEHKSDPRDAHVIADQVRMRWLSLPEVAPKGERTAEEVARLAERNGRELGPAVDGEAARVGRETSLREILPLFVERDVPVAVVDGEGRVEGVVYRGSLIAGSPPARSRARRTGPWSSGVTRGTGLQIRARKQ